MKVKFNGQEYEYKPTGNKARRGGGIDINGNETDVRTHRQYGLYNEHGEKIYTCGSGGNEAAPIRVYNAYGKCIGTASRPNNKQN